MYLLDYVAGDLRTSGPIYGVPFTISGDAYSGDPQNVDKSDVSLNTFDKPKSAICKTKIS